MGPTVTGPVQDPLAVLLLDKQLYIVSDPFFVIGEVFFCFMVVRRDQVTRCLSRVVQSLDILLKTTTVEKLL